MEVGQHRETLSRSKRIRDKGEEKQKKSRHRKHTKNAKTQKPEHPPTTTLVVMNVSFFQKQYILTLKPETIVKTLDP
jgi:hypothetical protein